MKQRLIDANKLMPNAELKGRYDLVSAWDIANQPTVEAIPVELIKKKLLSCQYEYENDYDKGFDNGWNCVIKTLLKDWEKENEAD